MKCFLLGFIVWLESADRIMSPVAVIDLSAWMELFLILKKNGEKSETGPKRNEKKGNDRFGHQRRFTQGNKKLTIQLVTVPVCVVLIGPPKPKCYAAKRRCHNCPIHP